MTQARAKIARLLSGGKRGDKGLRKAFIPRCHRDSSACRLKGTTTIPISEQTARTSDASGSPHPSLGTAHRGGCDLAIAREIAKGWYLG